jgi:hypothetical protein
MSRNDDPAKKSTGVGVSALPRPAGIGGAVTIQDGRRHRESRSRHLAANMPDPKKPHDNSFFKLPYPSSAFLLGKS